MPELLGEIRTCVRLVSLSMHCGPFFAGPAPSLLGRRRHSDRGYNVPHVSTCGVKGLQENSIGPNFRYINQVLRYIFELSFHDD